MGRYISLERLLEENKDRYYETLAQSSQGWHEGKHDPWPYTNSISIEHFVGRDLSRHNQRRVETRPTNYFPFEVEMELH